MAGGALMQIFHAFAVPFGEAYYPSQERDTLCTELKTLLESRRAQYEDQVRNEIKRDTQKGNLFESRFNLFNWPDEPIQKLRRFTVEQLRLLLSHITTLAPHQLEALQFHFHTWFHLTGFAGRQGIHNHSNASWSGIFCVDPGEMHPDFPDSGVVAFHDPRTNADIYEDSGNRYLKPPFAHGFLRIKHEKGRLFLFPSYLLHEIFPYFGQRHRIIIAFNCRVLLPEDYPEPALRLIEEPAPFPPNEKM
ncbi:MAG: hypothetical protein D6694_01630 [Gammaproteobacteria bacterium]|nr:MAG: hypothetical protein D6694_01630 [Gammaproteobacteria bacterium]